MLRAMHGLGSFFVSVFLLAPSCLNGGIQGDARSSHTWIHPNTYFEVSGLADFLERCQENQEWSRASLLALLPNGRLIAIQAMREPLSDSDEFYLNCNGDMRWVVHSSSLHENVSRSFVEGFNGGSSDVVFNGQLHSIGGYGLWRRHFDLLRFEGGELAWQLLSTTGAKPADRDKDRSRSFAHGQELALLLDKGVLAGEYGKPMYDLYQLDLATRTWTCQGEIDARFGVLDRSLTLESGVLATNLAGELLWWDLESQRVTAVSNSASTLEAFQSWYWEEPGRMTFVGDSFAWAEFKGERLELQIPWDRLGESPSFMLARPRTDATVPVSSGQTSSEIGELNRLGEGRWERIFRWLPWGILAILLGRFGFRKRASRKKDGAEKRVVEGASSQSRISPLTSKVMEHSGKRFETEQLDELLGIDHLSSPETLRSQRARLISKVNTENRVLSGKDLIVRRQSQEDRRRSVYHIVP